MAVWVMAMLSVVATIIPPTSSWAVLAGPPSQLQLLRYRALHIRRRLSFSSCSSPLLSAALSSLSGPAGGKDDNSALNDPAGGLGGARSVAKSLPPAHTWHEFASFPQQLSRSAASPMNQGL